MLRVCFLALATALLLGLAPSAALARSQPLAVSVFDGATRQPISGTTVEITDMNGNKLGSATTGANGAVRITFEVPDDVKTVMITTGTGAFMTLNIEYASPEGMGTFLYRDTRAATGAELVGLARAAIARCDKAAYDRWAEALNQIVTQREQQRDRQQQKADEMARDRNLRVTDLAGAQKDLQRAEKAQAKLDPSVRNPQALADLEEYIETLQSVEALKAAIEEARRARESLPPFPDDCKKDKKVGLVPGTTTCPDGSGGLLAGALNGVFDADLEASCDETRRRDTDRPKKHDRHDREHRD